MTATTLRTCVEATTNESFDCKLSEQDLAEHSWRVIGMYLACLRSELPISGHSVS